MTDPAQEIERDILDRLRDAGRQVGPRGRRMIEAVAERAAGMMFMRRLVPAQIPADAAESYGDLASFVRGTLAKLDLRGATMAGVIADDVALLTMPAAGRA